jgi:hypothetical protein
MLVSSDVQEGYSDEIVGEEGRKLAVHQVAPRIGYCGCRSEVREGGQVRRCVERTNGKTGDKMWQL